MSYCKSVSVPSDLYPILPNELLLQIFEENDEEYYFDYSLINKMVYFETLHEREAVITNTHYKIFIEDIFNIIRTDIFPAQLRFHGYSSTLYALRYHSERIFNTLKLRNYPSVKFSQKDFENEETIINLIRTIDPYLIKYEHCYEETCRSEVDYGY